MTNEEAHRLAREKGVSRPFYALVKALMVPFMRRYFGLRVSGTDRVPRNAPVIIAPNHKIRDPDRLGSPRSGVGRLGLQAGAPLVPAAISGTQRLFLGPPPKPERVQLAFGEPIMVAEDEPSLPSGARAGLRDAVAAGRAGVRAAARAPGG